METLNVSVPVPREVVNILKVREDSLAPLLRQTIALELFREGLVSIGKASEIAGLTRGKMMDLLASKKIPINYVPSDLREDVQALQRL